MSTIYCIFRRFASRTQAENATFFSCLIGFVGNIRVFERGCNSCCRFLTMAASSPLDTEPF